LFGNGPDLLKLLRQSRSRRADTSPHCGPHHLCILRRTDLIARKVGVNTLNRNEFSPAKRSGVSADFCPPHACSSDGGRPREAHAGSSPRRATFFLSDQKESKKSPLLRRPSLRSESPAMLATRRSRRTRSATRRSDNCAKSVHEARCARASDCCASRLLQRGVREQPNSQKARPDIWLSPAVRYALFSPQGTRSEA
jgi:hypothetical protein